MPIAGGIVVPVQKDAGQNLALSLTQETGVEVSGIGPGGIAVVLERASMAGVTGLAERLAARTDVAAVQVTYCNWEDTL